MEDEVIEQATAAPGEKRALPASQRLHKFLVEQGLVPNRTKRYTIRVAVGRPLEIECEYYEW